MGRKVVHSLYNYCVLNKRYLTKVEVPQLHKSRIMCRSRKEKPQTPKFLISNVSLPSDVNLVSSSLISFVSRGLRFSHYSRIVNIGSYAIDSVLPDF